MHSPKRTYGDMESVCGRSSAKHLWKIIMNDSNTTIKDLKDKINIFVSERKWDQFHSPKNVSMALAAEAAELMEIFLWVESKDSRAQLEKYRQDVEHEIADVIFAAFCFCLENNIDISSALQNKMKKMVQKYPVDFVKEKHLKYPHE